MVGFCTAGEILIAISQLKYMVRSHSIPIDSTSPLLTSCDLSCVYYYYYYHYFQLGIKVPNFVYAYQTLGYLFKHLGETDGYTVLLGSTSFIFLFWISRWRRKTAKLPSYDLDDPVACQRAKRIRILRLLCNFAPFVVIILTSVISYIMAKHGHKVAVIGIVPQGLHLFEPYNMTSAELQELMPQCLILAVISFMLTYSVRWVLPFSMNNH